jgi:hypothetical protein
MVKLLDLPHREAMRRVATGAPVCVFVATREAGELGMG